MGAGLGRLQATTVAHRLLRLVRRRAAHPSGARPAVGLAGRPGATASRASGRTGPVRRPAGRDLLDGDGLDLPRDVLARAVTASGSRDAVVGLADVWSTLGVREREGVARPLGRGEPGALRLGGDLARQVDETTCGSAVLAMLAAAGDPFLALWLVAGRLVPDGSGGHHRPPELRGAGAPELGLPAPAQRFGALQRAVQRASTRRALGPLPWPAALGTPPWGAARVARFPGTAYTSLLVDDTDTGHLTAVLDRVDEALAAGLPVPLYTGGDLSRGVATALPRHVVLVVPPADDARRPAAGRPSYAVYEPASARVHRLTRAEILAPSGPRPSLGGWSHVCWAVLPRGSAGE